MTVRTLVQRAIKGPELDLTHHEKVAEDNAERRQLKRADAGILPAVFHPISHRRLKRLERKDQDYKIRLQEEKDKLLDLERGFIVDKQVETAIRKGLDGLLGSVIEKVQMLQTLLETSRDQDIEAIAQLKRLIFEVEVVALVAARPNQPVSFDHELSDKLGKILTKLDEALDGLEEEKVKREGNGHDISYMSPIGNGSTTETTTDLVATSPDASLPSPVGNGSATEPTTELVRTSLSASLQNLKEAESQLAFARRMNAVQM